MNYRMTKYTIGLILIFEGAFFLIPSLTALVYREWQSLCSFAITMAVCIGLGALMSLKKPHNTRLYARDGFVIVSLGWIALSIFGAFPLLFSGAYPSYIDALFEIVSGFTTTGATVIKEIEALPKSILMWRSFSHWVGGMGVLVFVMAILPKSGAQNIHVMRAESPGPEVSKLVPRLRNTAIILYGIYICLTLLAFLFFLADMPLFDALNSAFSVAGTGGFGTKNDSMNSYSTYIKIVCSIFMLVFSINFNAYYLVIKKRLKDAFNTELKVFLAIVVVFTALITLNTLGKAEGAETPGEALLGAFFTVSALISSTGFATVDFNLWPMLSKILALALIFIGACAGSTGGGFKVSRIILLFKGMTKEIRSQLNPRSVKNISLDGRTVEDEVIKTVNAYLVTYFLIFTASMLLLSLDNYALADGKSSLVTNFTATLTSLSNTGPGLDMVGPVENYSFFSPLSKLVLIFDMLAGRLELFPMLLLFNPSTYKK